MGLWFDISSGGEKEHYQGSNFIEPDTVFRIVDGLQLSILYCRVLDVYNRET